MNYEIKEPSLNRLSTLLRKDKCDNPQYVCEVLKGELEPIIQNYISLSTPVNVRFRKFGEKLLFSIEIDAERIRPFGYIPR